MSKNPFKPGDFVVYSPSSSGRGKSVMTDLKNLQPGQRYKVVCVENAAYLVLEGFESSSTGGIHWTEFRDST